MRRPIYLYFVTKALTVVTNSQSVVWTVVLKNTGTVVLVYNISNGLFVSVVPGGNGTLEPLGLDTNIYVKAGDVVVGTIVFDGTYPGSFSVHGGEDVPEASFDLQVSMAPV